MNRRNQKHQDNEHQSHLRDLRRGEADTTEQVAKSQEAIEDSLALLRRNDRRRSRKSLRRVAGIPKDPDRAAREKSRPSR
jgi:hypothetical protein